MRTGYGLPTAPIANRPGRPRSAHLWGGNRRATRRRFGAKPSRDVPAQPSHQRVSLSKDRASWASFGHGSHGETENVPFSAGMRRATAGSDWHHWHTDACVSAFADRLARGQPQTISARASSAAMAASCSSSGGTGRGGGHQGLDAAGTSRRGGPAVYGHQGASRRGGQCGSSSPERRVPAGAVGGAGSGRNQWNQWNQRVRAWGFVDSKAWNRWNRPAGPWS